MTIEDESAVANVIVWPKVFERLRPIVLGARYVAVIGRVQEESGVIHVVAEQLEDLTYLLAQLAEHGAEIDGLARCDEVRRPIEEQREARNAGGRHNRLVSLMREMPELAGDSMFPLAARRMRRRGGLLRHHLAAPDIDAVGLKRAIRLLDRSHDRNMRTGLQLALIARLISEDARIRAAR